MDSKETFLKLAGKPLSDKFTNIKSVKIVYDYTEKKLYFFNSVLYKYHHNFCHDVLNFSDDLNYFNDISYNSEPTRILLLGNLNYLNEKDNWVLELAPIDEMNTQLIQFFYQQVAQHTFFKDRLKFYLNTPRLIQLKEDGKLKIPCVYSDFMFQNITEQTLETGKAVGILRKYDLKQYPKLQPRPDEIIMINTTPEVLPRVKGIIITELQTPLSHLVLLAKNRNVPLYADKLAWSKPALTALEGQKVELIVSENGYTMQATQKNVSPEQPVSRIVLKPDYTVQQIVDLNMPLPGHPADIIGSKASNLALLKIVQKRVKGFKTPEHAYAIPFYYYKDHIQKNHLDKQIDALLQIPVDSTEQIAKALKQLRKAIKQTAIDSSLIQNISHILSQQGQFTHFKFRSSTNAEDLKGFNGAGLYDSKSAVLNDPDKTIQNAILEVWASLWNERAFYERELFHIDHQSCAMGVLIHRSFPDEQANGVLITRNLYRDRYQGITVNVQKGEASVVTPDSGVTCDEFYVHSFNIPGHELSIDYRSTSSINDHKAILKDKEIQQLYHTSLLIEKHINRLWRTYHMCDRNMPLDIEFKLEGSDRELYIKQVRAYVD
ncbi:PEP/pyruvate-binding domain-containing protein [Edaphocola flava]|uniref:PEP/pyruvate-binding domain-containing protein n=1 Tax=Edaphocola flava TaxID=2499629 RepID=UPI0013871FF3|nr:PEP/pyruvate-binding domain-containing protein [Edaphocola flava]